jgi:hypothetical protein
VDIACRTEMTVLDIPARELDRHQDRLTRAIEAETRFGVGASFKNRRQHEVLDADWDVSPITKQNKDRAWSQLGTSGSSNHFVEFGLFTAHGQIHGLAPGTYVALLSHSGSRGTGAAVPAGIFEYQHSTGNDTHQSIAKGFESWMQLDLPVFLDALRTKPQRCTFLEFELPADVGRPAQKRRVVLGPVSHLVSRPEESGSEEHPFCPCCLFTRSGDVMKPKILDNHFYGIRLFAMRGQYGDASADCRLNGEDWEPGKNALIAYVNSWPNRGVEFRKQYVILQTQPV